MPYRIFVDLDGVLVDFEKGVLEATGKRVDEQSPSEMWAVLARTPEFYARLDWLPDGRKLWEFLRPFKPTILTGLPLGRWAAPQKRTWCRIHLGPEVPVLTCLSRHKAATALEVLRPGEVPLLIDDRESLRPSWEEIGGIFIHHTSADATISSLTSLLREVLEGLD
ncbi:hypothetical protein [Spirochaeta thermophila]|uniref:5' nucleotidase, deoxy (Pyrimidine), cytosolic type C protein (NT5C) n=1 Tax=Winmispira thermophila (strain ATCC 49972 / DSM 6192 / RI 19.B1) TaxID=665571 RepID=E0RU76_WINT6|nr:hypothetical protein [Spirochaeta thermophila]ADN02297.1 hypothetical protein STHERM_c13570 [Spirochaeta thermophila DSM 6192]